MRCEGSNEFFGVGDMEFSKVDVITPCSFLSSQCSSWKQTSPKYIDMFSFSCVF
jgi:hypothetical protein